MAVKRGEDSVRRRRHDGRSIRNPVSDRVSVWEGHGGVGMGVGFGKK